MEAWQRSLLLVFNTQHARTRHLSRLGVFALSSNAFSCRASWLNSAYSLLDARYVSSFSTFSSLSSAFVPFRGSIFVARIAFRFASIRVIRGKNSAGLLLATHDSLLDARYLSGVSVFASLRLIPDVDRRHARRLVT